MKRSAINLGLIITALATGCISAYTPEGGTLVKGEGDLSFSIRQFDARDGFFVVQSWRLVDPRHKVCIFENRFDADDYYDLVMSASGSSVSACFCGNGGKIHPPDFRIGGLCDRA